MDCVNHIGVSSTAYCQNCGQALCSGCTRTAAGGQVLCDPCWRAWQSYQQPFIAPVASGPNPQAAAALGLIPGVGAMYNGQFLKAFIHVIIFAALISLAEYHGIFGLFIAAWILYQSFEAYHTAKALRDCQPLPDPFGLNEVGSWLNLGTRPFRPDRERKTMSLRWRDTRPIRHLTKPHSRRRLPALRILARRHRPSSDGSAMHL
jgi:TM2 domain-containing membrane protein YozV